MRHSVIINIVILLAALAGSNNAYAQRNSIKIQGQTFETVFGGKAALNFGQASFSKWAAGGQDLVNILGHFLLTSKRASKTSEWDNYIDMIYGTQSLDRQDFIKTDDKYEFNSKYGIRMADPRLFLTTALQFKNQFTNGYSYDNERNPTLISAPFSPAYITAYLGLDYKPFNGLSIFISPLTAKMTIVSKDALSQQGAFGVDPGEHFLTAYGPNLTLTLDRELIKNIVLISKLDLFSNYHDVSSAVVDWSTSIDIKIMRFVAVSIAMNLLYDENVKWREVEIIDDVEHVISDSPKVQYKQLISIGLLYDI